MRHRKKRGDSTSDYLLVILLVTVMALVIGAGLWFYFQKSPPVNTLNLCPVDGPRGRYVVLIDKTDPLTLNQKEALKSLLGNILEKAPTGYMISIFVLGEIFTQSTEPIIERCNPGDAKNASVINSNVKKLRDQYEKQYLEPIMKSYIDQLNDTKPGSTSPIFEMLQLISVKSFGNKAFGGEKRLFIISDMLHNTPQYSMFGVRPDFNAFTATPYGHQQTAVQFKNVHIEEYLLLFQPQIQKSANFKTFWESYFLKTNRASYTSQPLGF